MTYHSTAPALIRPNAIISHYVMSIEKALSMSESYIDAEAGRCKPKLYVEKHKLLAKKGGFNLPKSSNRHG